MKQNGWIGEWLGKLCVSFTAVMAVSGVLTAAMGNRPYGLMILGVLGLLALLWGCYALLGRLPLGVKAVYALQYVISLGVTLGIGPLLNWFSLKPRNIVAIAALVLLANLATYRMLAAQNRRDAARINEMMQGR